MTRPSQRVDGFARYASLPGEVSMEFVGLALLVVFGQWPGALRHREPRDLLLEPMDERNPGDDGRR